MSKLLEGKTAIVLGVWNKWSIAYAIAQAFAREGANLLLTYQNERAKPTVEELGKELGATGFYPCDVQVEGDIANLTELLRGHKHKLDVMVHSLAGANHEDLNQPFVNTSRDGFRTALEISAYSLISLSKALAPLMTEGGAIMTMTYLGSTRVVTNYNVMGVAKAALEAAVRYVAAELGPKGIRVHAISPGPLATRAASGIPEFDELMDKAQSKAPARSLVSIDDVGNATAFLALDGAKLITGSVLYIDGGYHIID
jgi:enoyl-[acyl-carrier protein] reductase I